MDIRPPRKRPAAQAAPVLPEPVVVAEAPAKVESEQVSSQTWYRRKKVLVYGLATLFSVTMMLLMAWFAWALAPVDRDDASQVRFVVAEGTSTAEIASSLKDHELIKSSFAFRVYTETTGAKGKLQAGTFGLSPSQSVAEMVDRMIGGSMDEVSVIILPGLTLKEQMDPEIKNSLAWQGFSQEELEVAFTASYDHPLFEGKPQGTTLEGYLYPETYRINTNDSVTVLLDKAFDEFYDRLTEENLLTGFTAQNLNLYQAVTMASIVQMEVSNPSDQQQVAQVFLKRLREGIVLGSDVTFFYAADQLGVEPRVNLESPYNTRKYPGLPPGPIANMNLSALRAVANPAPGDYLYFVAGDGADAGKTFFARTEAEHNANVAAHCHELCR